MTSLAVSLSVDSRGPCALYIVTDSRITWQSPPSHWDSGQKTFASRRFPDVFGFCGDAYFPPMILGQAIEQLDAGLICAADADAITRQSAIAQALGRVMKEVAGIPPVQPSFVIYHGARDGVGMRAAFRLWQMRYSQEDRKWITIDCAIATDHSYLVHLDGSGRKIISDREVEWKRSSAAGTSRSAIWAFCEALRSGKDRFSGGPPQLVGLWRIGAARNFGFLWNGKKYYSGMEVVGNDKEGAVQWFNHLFERADPYTGRRFKSAQRHVKPTRNSQD